MQWKEEEAEKRVDDEHHDDGVRFGRRGLREDARVCHRDARAHGVSASCEDAHPTVTFDEGKKWPGKTPWLAVPTGSKSCQHGRSALFQRNIGQRARARVREQQHHVSALCSRLTTTRLPSSAEAVRSYITAAHVGQHASKFSRGANLMAVVIRGSDCARPVRISRDGSADRLWRCAVPLKKTLASVTLLLTAPSMGNVFVRKQFLGPPR